jgi:hypothetical protein
MEALLPHLFVGAVIAVVIMWSWGFHFWSNSPTARRSRSPLWLGFTATASSALFLVAGLIGFDLSKRSTFFAGAAWVDGVIWATALQSSRFIKEDSVCDTTRV